MSDYYELLQIPKDADINTIKKGYKRMAMRHHPDKGGDSEMFKKIAEAYDVLSNPEKKRVYDQGGNPNIHMSHQFHSFDPNELFQQFFSHNQGFFDDSEDDLSFFHQGPFGIRMNIGGKGNVCMTSVSTTTQIIGNKKITREVKVTNGIREESIIETDLNTNESVRYLKNNGDLNAQIHS